jgi:hypothetical protein
MPKTRKNKRKSVTRGWKKEQPSYHQRSIMLKRCGKKCFLGSKKSYPICKKNTCKISSKGVYSAYIRARQYHKKSISKKAEKILKSIGVKS